MLKMNIRRYSGCRFEKDIHCVPVNKEEAIKSE